MDRTEQIIGPITLTTGDLRRSTEFYRNAIGLENSDEKLAHFGKGKNDLVILEHRPTTRARRDGQPACIIWRFCCHRVKHSRGNSNISWKLGSRFTGRPIIGVSEAIYLADPDGNGIEIYCDRPRETWARKGGQIQMVTESLDIDDLMREINGQNEQWNGMPDGTTMGHIHLRVGDLAAAEAFYREVIGMDVTARYGSSATFISFKGYHHHLGLNTWESKDAPAAAENSIGLKSFQINLHGNAELERVKSAADQKGVPMEEMPTGILLRDPSGNRVIVRS